jgi:hypothetical protein
VSGQPLSLYRLAHARVKKIKDMKEDMNANKKTDRDLLAMLEAKIDANQTQTDDNQERIDVNVKEIEGR